MSGAPELIQERTPSRSSTVKNGVSVLEGGITWPHQLSQVAGGVQSELVVHPVTVPLHRFRGTSTQAVGSLVTHGTPSSLSIIQLAPASPGWTRKRLGTSELTTPTNDAWVTSGQVAPSGRPKQQVGHAGVRLVA